MDKEAAKPIQLISIHNKEKGSRLEVNLKALELIKNAPGPISIISVCGQQRSGKSFLLNSLFFSGRGFEVSSTTETCTKGLLLWNQPISAKNSKGTTWIIDSQGFGSTEEDPDYDGKIFLLTALLSSTMIYNSFGPIDQNALQKFLMMCQTATIIDSNLNSIQLYWILRDFSLAMENRDGCPLTPDQYLQNSLQCTKTEHFIGKIFDQRHCVPLIRPTINEEKLSKLSNTDLKQLRPEFVDEIYKLRKKLINGVTPKTLNKHLLTGESFVLLISNIVDQLNEGRVQCNLQTSWNHISSFECEKIFERTLSEIKDKINQLRKVLPLTKEDIARIRKECLSNGAHYYHKKAKGLTINPQVSEERLKQKILELVGFLEKQNSEHVHDQLHNFLSQHIKQIGTKLKNILNLSNFPRKYFQQFAYIKEQVKNKYSGFQKWPIVYYNSVEEVQESVLEDFAQRTKKNEIERNKKYEQLKANYKKIEGQYRILKASDSESRKYTSVKIDELRQQKDQQITELTCSNADLQAKIKRVVRQSENQILKLKESMKEKEQQVEQLEHKKQLADILHDQSLKLLKHKCQMQEVLLKDQQQKIKSTSASLQQLHKEYQTKLRLVQQDRNTQLGQLSSRVSQTQLYLNNERSKYQEFMQNGKVQEQQLMTELAIKNQQIFELRRQLNLEHQTLTQDFETILTNQRNKNQQKLNALVEHNQTLQRKLELYQMKLEEEIVKNQTMTDTQQRLFQIEQILNNKNTQIESLKSDLGRKSEQLQHQKSSSEKFYSHMKESLEEEIKQLQEELIKIKKGNKQEIEKMRQEYKELIEESKIMEGQASEKLTNKLRELEDYHDQQQTEVQQAYEKRIESMREQIQRYITQIEEIIGQKREVIAEKQQLVLSIQQLKRKENKICTECGGRQMENIKLKQEKERLQNERDNLIKQFEKTQVQLEQVKITLSDLDNEKSKLSYRLEMLTEQKSNYELQHSKQKQDLSVKTKTLLQQIDSLKLQLQNSQRQKVNKTNQLNLKSQITLKKQQMYKQNLDLYKETIEKIRSENSELRAAFEERFIKSSPKIEVKQEETPTVQVSFQDCGPLRLTRKATSEDWDSVKMQYDHRIQKLQQQNNKLRRMLQEQQKLNDEKRKPVMKLNLLDMDQKNSQLEETRKENKQLRKQIQDILQKEIESMESKKQLRNNQSQMMSRNIDIDQSRIKSLREQIESLNKKYQQKIKHLEQLLQQSDHDKYLLKQQVTMLKSQLDRRGHYNQKILEEQIQMLKKQKASYEEMANKKIQSIQQSLSNKVQQCDKKVAQTETKFKKLRNEAQKQKSKLEMENEKNKTKYQQLLKVNNNLINEIEVLRRGSSNIKADTAKQDSKLTDADSGDLLKDKYNKRIAELFK